MIYGRPPIVPSALFALVLLTVFVGSAAADTLLGRVVRVIDGDTLVLLLSGKVEERVRLAGIDCPERGQAYGTKAKEALLARVGGVEVSVDWEKRDRYNRVVGKVVDGEGDVNLSLGARGCAGGTASTPVSSRR